METGEIKAISKTNVHMICSAQVILSPAIALKELLENSIDAGATNVEIKLVDFGAKNISISDNGSGVKPIDFESLTAKHHTSKLSDFSDLDSVETFGFRGEALSSLCAVGNLSVTSRHSDSPLASRLEFDSNGVIVSKKMESRPVGTSVTFEDIFHNFPVRQKELLRNLKKEYAKLVHILQSYGLAAKNVRINALSFKQGKKSSESIMSTSGKGSLKDCITDIFGPKQADTLAKIEPLVIGDFILEGYVSSCQHGQGRSKPDRQFFFVNNRPCDLKQGSKSLNDIYHQFNRHQFPFCAILINTKSQGQVDVNLTPDKRQVFIQNENAIWTALKDSLKQLYDKIAPPEAVSCNLTEFFVKEEKIAHEKPPKQDTEEIEAPNLSKEAVLDKKKNSISMDDPNDKPPPKCDDISIIRDRLRKKSHNAKREPSWKIEHFYATKSEFEPPPIPDPAKNLPSKALELVEPREKKVKVCEEIMIQYDEACDSTSRKSVNVTFSFDQLRTFWQRKPFNEESSKEGRHFLTSITDRSGLAEMEFSRHLTKGHFGTGQIIGQFNLGFIIVRLLPNDLFIVDQHATDEKYRFETLMRESKVTPQPLLCPQDLDLGPGKREILKDNLEAISSLGFAFDHQLRLTKVPHCDRLVLSKDDLDEVLYVLAEEGHFNPSTYQFSRLRTLFASRACRSAVMIGTALTSQQMSKIVHHMAEMDQPWNCPHGRPTLRHLVNLQMLH